MALQGIKKKYVEGVDYVIVKAGSPDVPPGVIQNIECVRCQYATLDASRFNEHMDANEHHRWRWPTEEEGGVYVTDRGTENEKEHAVKGYHPLAKSNPFSKRATHHVNEEVKK